MPVTQNTQTIGGDDVAVSEMTGMSDANIFDYLTAAKGVFGSGLSETEITAALQKANNPYAKPGASWPVLKKLDSNPVIELADQTAVSILWPYIVDLSKEGGSGLALFWSTDHASHANSGTWLATAPDIDGPWTQHGMIFRDDTTGGEQHETPSVVWDEVNNRWLMYYQLKNVSGYTGQITMVATVDTVLTGGIPNSWSVIGVAAAEEYTANAGDGDSTYFKPFRFDGGWFAHSLYGGTKNSRRAFWTSHDNGITYQNHPQIIQSNQHLIQHFTGFDAESWMVKINNGTHFVKDNQLWMIAPVGAAAAGGADTLYRTGVFRVGNDGVTFGRGIDITEDLQVWEDPLIGVDEFGSVFDWQGRTYVVFKSGGGEGGFGISEIL